MTEFKIRIDNQGNEYRRKVFHAKQKMLDSKCYWGLQGFL